MSDIDNKVKMIVEGLLLASGRPLSINDIAGVFQEDERPDKKELKENSIICCEQQETVVKKPARSGDLAQSVKEILAPLPVVADPTAGCIAAVA